MVGFIIRWFANILSLFAVARIVPGITLDSSRTLVWAAFVLGLVNALLRPVILLWTLPLNVLSLGLLTLFINAFLFYAASRLVKGFFIPDFGSAFWGAAAFSLISFILNLLINPRGRIDLRYRSRAAAAGGRRKDFIDVEASREDEPAGKLKGKDE